MRECVDIEIVFHPAISHAEHYGGMKFLGDHGFLWIGFYLWHGEREENREINLLRRGDDGISEADIDLERDFCFSEHGGETDPDSTILWRRGDWRG
ncbi:MAG: hypothetical protein P8123_08270, partial [bacterium]